MKERGAQVALLVVMVGVSVYLWNTLLLYPIKLFVVLLHELSHGLAAVATGGEIVSIEVSERIGGVCKYRGGNPLVVASAGYLGSLFWGGLILVAAARTRASRGIALTVVLVMMIATVLWIRNTFGVYYTAGFAIVLLLMSRYLPQWMLRLVLQFLGTASCLYVLVDIYEDLIVVYQEGSDADALMSLTGIPAVLWGILWGALAAAMLGYSFYMAGTAKPRSAAENSEHDSGA